MKNRYTLKIAYISIFGALALLISLSKLEIPYPIAPFLKIDFSEIVDLLAFFLGGEYVGILTATIHFLGLMVNAEFLIGPPMKYIAVLSMFLGIFISEKIFGKYDKWKKKEFGVATTLSSLLRAFIMIGVNLIIILWIAPEFYDFFSYQLTSLGYANVTFLDVFIYMSLIVGSYNIIQNIVTFIVGQSTYWAARRYIHA